MGALKFVLLFGGSVFTRLLQIVWSILISPDRLRSFQISIDRFRLLQIAADPMISLNIIVSPKQNLYFIEKSLICN